jgi:hypothetical protein
MRRPTRLEAPNSVFDKQRNFIVKRPEDEGHLRSNLLMALLPQRPAPIKFSMTAASSEEKTFTWKLGNQFLISYWKEVSRNKELDKNRVWTRRNKPWQRYSRSGVAQHQQPPQPDPSISSQANLLKKRRR